MNKTEIKARLEFRRAALERLRKAYLALIDGGVKSYELDGRNLTRFDLPDLEKAIEDGEKKIDELEALLDGGAARKAFAVIPRDW